MTDGDDERALDTEDPVSVAADFVRAVRAGEDATPYEHLLRDLDSADLAASLADDEARTAFWCNVYNGAAQRTLRERPEVYSRWRFFRRNLVAVAGTPLTLDDIEHGILRGSQFKYGLGYVRKPDLVVGAFEQAHRVAEPDWRVHFALNCGAASCPPVAAYEADAIDEQLDAATASYLATETTYDAASDTVAVTPLFRWYRGDFGGAAGIREILRDYEVIPADAEPTITYGDYDWSLAAGEFRESGW